MPARKKFDTAPKTPKAAKPVAPATTQVEVTRHQDSRTNIPTRELGAMAAADEAAPKAILYPRARLNNAGQKLQAHSPARELVARRDRIRDLERRLATLPKRQVEIARERFRSVDGILRVLGPGATLRRGYSITTDKMGHLIRKVAQAKPKSRIVTRVSDGAFESETIEPLSSDS